MDLMDVLLAKTLAGSVPRGENISGTSFTYNAFKGNNFLTYTDPIVKIDIEVMEDTNYESRLYFTTATTGFEAISFPAGAIIPKNVPLPTFEGGKSYQVSILKNTVVAWEV